VVEKDKFKLLVQQQARQIAASSQTDLFARTEASIEKFVQHLSSDSAILFYFLTNQAVNQLILVHLCLIFAFWCVRIKKECVGEVTRVFHTLRDGLQANQVSLAKIIAYVLHPLLHHYVSLELMMRCQPLGMSLRMRVNRMNNVAKRSKKLLKNRHRMLMP
jgi:hypothetical protein